MLLEKIQIITPAEVTAWFGLDAVPFQEKHLRNIQLTPNDRESLERMPSHYQAILQQSHDQVAYALLDADDVVAIFGLYSMWPGVAELWAIPSIISPGRGIRAVRGGRRFCEAAAVKLELWRLQAVVNSRWLANSRFVKMLGFEKEATLFCFGPERENFHVYARFFE